MTTVEKVGQMALFAGDVSWDTLMLVSSELPGPDEKALVSTCIDSVGGVAANAAMACAKAGTSVRLLSVVGDDAAGGWVRQQLADLGISTHLDAADGPTARAVILLDSDGEKRLLLYPGSGMYPRAASVEAVDLTSVSWLHTALYDVGCAATLIDRCRRADIGWSIDLEPATIPSDRDALRPALRGCDTVFVNDQAWTVLGADAAAWLESLQVRWIVRTRGPAGARLLSDEDDIAVAAPDLSEPVRDTTGAGDALAGWYVTGRLGGQPPLAALRRAVIAASWSVRNLGTSTAFPTRSQLDMILGSAPQEKE